MAIVRVKIKDWQDNDPFILPEESGENYNIHPFAKAGVNAFIFITDGFEDKLLVNYTPVGIPDDIPANFELLIGRVMGKALGLPFQDEEYDEE